MPSTVLPTTSVVIVTYHTGSVLDRTVEAVLAQTTPVELILVNNGNPPSVEAKFAALAAREPRLKWITGHGNIGFGPGCNRGANAASNPFLLFLNPDCVLPPNTLELLHAHAKNLYSPFMLGARLVDEAGGEQRGCRRATLTPLSALVEVFSLHSFFPCRGLNWQQEPLPNALTAVPAISGAFMFLPRADFWSIEGFDPAYFLHVEDLDFCLRFQRAGGHIFFAPDVVAIHIGSTSRTTPVFVEKHKAKGFVHYFRKNFGHVYPPPVLWVLYAAVWLRFGIRRAMAFFQKAKGVKVPR